MGGALVLPNDTSTGTTATYLAVVNSAGNAIKATTGNTDVPVFICISGCGTSGNATLAAMGTATCNMDAGGAVIGHFIQASTTTAGACTDAGSTAPTSGWVIGQSASSAIANATATIVLSQGYSAASGGGMFTMTQNVVTGSRMLGTVYQNTTAWPILITISEENTNGGITSAIVVNTDSSSSPTTAVAYAATSLATGVRTLTFVVLPGNYYEAIDNASATENLVLWVEWNVTAP